MMISSTSEILDRACYKDTALILFPVSIALGEIQGQMAQWQKWTRQAGICLFL